MDRNLKRLTVLLFCFMVLLAGITSCNNEAPVRNISLVFVNTETDEKLTHEVQAGQSFSLAGVTFTATGYSVTGWKAGSTVYPANTSVTFSSDTTLYSVWTENSYTVVFTSEEELSEQIPQINVKYTEVFNLPVPQSASGRIFTGWYDEDDEKLEMTGVSRLSSEKDDVVTLDARFIDNNVQSIELHTEPVSKTSVYGSDPDLNGLSIVVHYEGNFDRTVTYSGNETEFSTAFDNGNAGSDRTVTVTFADKNVQITGWTIQSKVIGLSWTDTSFTYNKESHIPSATATGLVGTDQCTVTVEGKQTNAGTYKAEATQLSNSNYALPPNKECEFTIAKAHVTVTKPIGRTVTYSGQNQQLITAGSLSNASAGSMLYFFEGSTDYRQAEEITASVAGTYSVCYICTGTDESNYEYSEPVSGGPVECVIATVFQTDSGGVIKRSLEDDYYSETVFETITILSGGATIIDDMLLSDVNVKNVVIDSGVEIIGEVAFASCNQMKSITLPDSITEIKMGAFAYCTSLEEIDLPVSLTTIEEHAFYGCESLTEILIPASVTTIEDYAFAHCTNLATVYYAGTEAQWNNINLGYYILAGCATDTVYIIGEAI